MKLWYAMENDGAGGCSFTLYESEELAKFAERMADQPFGEDTVGSISLESDSYIHVNECVDQIEDLIIQWDDRLKYSSPNQVDSLNREIAILMNMKVDRDNV